MGNGEITISNGVAGDPARSYQGGYGLSHIIERRKLTPEPSPAARLSEMLHQDYAPPEPTVPDYPPVRGFGYKIPIIPPRERPVSSIGKGGAATPSMPGATGQDFPVQPFVPALKVKPVPSNSLDRIGEAAARAVGELFEPPLGASDVAMGSLINRKPEDFEGPLGLVRTFNKALIQGGSKALDAAGRTAFAPIAGGIAALTQAARELGMSRANARWLERDLHGITLSVGAISGTVFGTGPRVYNGAPGGDGGCRARHARPRRVGIAATCPGRSEAETARSVRRWRSGG